MGLFIHTGEDNRQLRVIPDPAQSPFSRTPFKLGPLIYFLNPFRYLLGKKTSPQGLHYRNPQASTGCILQSFPASLAILIKVVILYQTKFPGIIIHNHFKILTITMIGKAHMSDSAGALCSIYKFFKPTMF